MQVELAFTSGDDSPASQSEKTVILMRRGDKYGMISVSLLNLEF